MQGWRRTMEDAHIAVTDVTAAGATPAQLFGVFDGHGGREVAKFCELHMAEELVKLEAFKASQNDRALEDVFHRMDDMLRDKAYLPQVQSLQHKDGDEDDDGPEGEDGVKNDAFEMIKKMLALKKAMSEGQANGEEPTEDMESDDTDVLPENKIQAGCTAVVTMIREGKLIVANAGDSRAVLCRGGQAVALSDDHKPAQETEKSRIEAAGGFLADIGGVCRVNGNLNLSRAIGDLKYKTNTDLQPHEQIITAHPDIVTETIGPNDEFLLLCCDGIWDVMTNQEAVDFVRARISSDSPLSDISGELVDACMASDPKETRGIGCDNMTAMIVQLNV